MERIEKASVRRFSGWVFLDPGPWVILDERGVDLDREVPNFAWCLMFLKKTAPYFSFGECSLEIPPLSCFCFIRQCLFVGQSGIWTFSRIPPSAFWTFLIRWGGGNLSLQVHPLTQYIQEKFGMHYTQDESYYMLDTAEDANGFIFSVVKALIRKR